MRQRGVYWCVLKLFACTKIMFCVLKYMRRSGAIVLKRVLHFALTPMRSVGYVLSQLNGDFRLDYDFC